MPNRPKQKTEPGLAAQVAACLHVPASELKGPPGEVRSPKFHGPGSLSVGSSVNVTSSPSAARQSIAVLGKAGAKPCLAAAIGKLGRGLAARSPGLTLGKATVRRLPVPKLGDESLALRIAVPVSAAGRTLLLVIDGFEMRVGRGEASLTVNSAGAAARPALETHLASLLATRLASELGRPVGA